VNFYIWTFFTVYLDILYCDFQKLTPIAKYQIKIQSDPPHMNDIGLAEDTESFGTFHPFNFRIIYSNFLP